MKRLLCTLTLFLLLCGSAYATDGTCTITAAAITPSLIELTFDFTSGTSGAFSPATSGAISGVVIGAVSEPNGTTPFTNASDILVTDSTGRDVLGDTGTSASPNYDGGGANLSSTVITGRAAKLVGAAAWVGFRGPLTVRKYNDSVTSSKGKLKLYIIDK